MEEQEYSWDCMEKAYEVSRSEIYKHLYSEPVGCAYFGDAYWEVWLMNMMGPRKQHYRCIARITNKFDIDEGMYLYIVPSSATKRGVRTGTASKSA